MQVYGHAVFTIGIQPLPFGGDCISSYVDTVRSFCPVTCWTGSPHGFNILSTSNVSFLSVSFSSLVAMQMYEHEVLVIGMESLPSGEGSMPSLASTKCSFYPVTCWTGALLCYDRLFLNLSLLSVVLRPSLILIFLLVRNTMHG